jgi:hypothetical protein
MEKVTPLTYVDLLRYPLEQPAVAKYIIAKAGTGEEFLVAMALDAQQDVFHDDILREAAKDMNQPLTCIGGGKLKFDSGKIWVVGGKSSVYGEDPNRLRTVAAFQKRFPEYIFIAE